ncbi:MAG: choice-of-anchor D domain-containing protein, partial [Deltaproteobacteria bacterium]
MVPCNDQENPVLMITAVGRGFRQGELEVFPDELDFGRVDAGSSETAQATVRNAGNGPLLVTSISLAPGSSPDFRILSSTRPGELAPGASAPVRIAYSPGLG